MRLFNISKNTYDGIAPGENIVLKDEVISFSENGNEIYSQKVQDYLDNGFEVATFDKGYREAKELVIYDGEEKEIVSVYRGGDKAMCPYCMRKELMIAGVEMKKPMTRDELYNTYYANIDKVSIENVKTKEEITDEERKALEAEYQEWISQ